MAKSPIPSPQADEWLRTKDVQQRLKIVQADEWLRPKEAQQYMKIGANKYYQLIKDGAFPTHKPDPRGRLVYVLKSDIDRFLVNGFPTAVAA